MGRQNNWTKKLNDPRHRVNVFKRINRRMPWLKIILLIVLVPMTMITMLAWRIWLNSPQRLAEAPAVMSVESPPRDAETVVAEVDEALAADDSIELYSEIPAEGRAKTELVERVDVRVLQGMKRVIPTGKPLVALTFDDGPRADTTVRILDELRKRRAVATFFVLGAMARANPEVVRRASREGHEIGSHTMYHQNLATSSEASMRADVNEAKGVIKGILGKDVRLTRPPYGSFNAIVANALGTPVINWSVDPSDWRKERRENSADIYYGVVDAVFDGAIVLMHDIYPSTADRVGPIVDELRARGYELVTVSELAEARGVTMANGVEYRSFEP